MNEKQKTKACSRCKVVKPVNEFYKRKDSKDGRRNDCKECKDEYNKEYREDNKEHYKQYDKQYYQDNKEKKLEQQRNRKANDPVYALRCNISATIANALKRNDGSKQGESVMKYLPYTIPELEDHLESQFVEGMSWENRSEWHIDHIYPHSLLPYDSMTHPNFQKAWALSNLQPLWASENQSKGNKVI